MRRQAQKANATISILHDCVLWFCVLCMPYNKSDCDDLLLLALSDDGNRSSCFFLFCFCSLFAQHKCKSRKFHKIHSILHLKCENFSSHAFHKPNVSKIILADISNQIKWSSSSIESKRGLEFDGTSKIAISFVIDSSINQKSNTGNDTMHER